MPTVTPFPPRAHGPGTFSVLIPAYRAAGYIEATLAAVAAQTLLPAEVLIYEDGRLDDLVARVTAIAATAPFPVRLLGCAQNQGVSHARNQLHAAATGEFLAYLDADDLWSPNHLATAANEFAAGADVTFCGVTFIDAVGTVLPGRGEPGPAELADIAGALFRYNFVQCTSTLCLRRAWLNRVGDFDETLSHGEDLDLWLRLLAAGAAWRYTGRLTCAYRKHPTSAMGQTRLATARLTAFYEKQLVHSLIPRDTTRAALIDNLRTNARFAWRDSPATAAAALARLLELDPWNLPARAAHLATTLLALRPRRGSASSPLTPSHSLPHSLK